MKTIEYKVSFEKMITRIPGLFAYLERDDFGEVSLHKATDSIDGCWGKIVENIKLPVELKIDNVTVLNSGEIYSFRTIIDYYYRYRDVLEENDDFKKFVENGIGKIEVEEQYGVATPKFIFLSNVKKLYNELTKMQKQCEFYKKLLEEGKTEEDKYLCCVCDRYEKIGGDDFIEYVKGLIPIAEERAQSYFKCAVEGAMTLSFDIDLNTTYKDLGIMFPYEVKDVNEDKVIICNSQKKYKISQPKQSEDNDSENKFITGQTDSKLTDLRRFATYYNDDGVPERFEEGKDWLFFYRKNVVTNIHTRNDELGNIISLSKAEEACTDPNDLFAYGDVITDIKADEEERTITFTYRTGVHLKSEEEEANPNYDEDGSILYTWSKFEWDGDEKIGVKYEETYNYEEDSELDKLINNEIKIEGTTIHFDEYINGEYDKHIPTYKFEFITRNNALNYDKTIAKQNVNIVSQLTDFEIYRNNDDAFIDYDVYREDYLIGITYKPTKKVDVSIDRGTTSVFEKHISFGSVKTLEDMENFKNNSFFKINIG